MRINYISDHTDLCSSELSAITFFRWLSWLHHCQDCNCFFFVCFFTERRSSIPFQCHSLYSALCVRCVLHVSDGFLGLFFRKMPAGKRDGYTRTLQMNPTLNRTIVRWRYFTTTTRILDFVVFLCKLRLLFFLCSFRWKRSVLWSGRKT